MSGKRKLTAEEKDAVLASARAKNPGRMVRVGDGTDENGEPKITISGSTEMPKGWTPPKNA